LPKFRTRAPVARRVEEREGVAFKGTQVSEAVLVEHFHGRVAVLVLEAVRVGLGDVVGALGKRALRLQGPRVLRGVIVGSKHESHGAVASATRNCWC